MALTDKFLISKDVFQGSVLVTGAGGCIGAWAVAILWQSGIDVIAADLSEDRRRLALVMPPEEADAVTWKSCDVTDFSAVRQMAADNDVQAIIHLAGLQVPFCAANPALGARVNVEGTINILQTARELGIKRTVYASSVAALAFPPGSGFKETLYGAYKSANEQSGFVYWADWQVPSVGIRPNVVYGIARDQGMSAKNTFAIQAAVMNRAFEIPYSGNYSWLYAGEAAAAFIACVAKDGEGAPVFNLNGSCARLEDGVAIINRLAPTAQITCSGSPFPFPPDLSDAPLRAHAADYPSVSVEQGITDTFNALKALQDEGRMPAFPEQG